MARRGAKLVKPYACRSDVVGGKLSPAGEPSRVSPSFRTVMKTAENNASEPARESQVPEEPEAVATEDAKPRSQAVLQRKPPPLKGAQNGLQGELGAALAQAGGRTGATPAVEASSIRVELCAAGAAEEVTECARAPNKKVEKPTTIGPVGNESSACDQELGHTEAEDVVRESGRNVTAPRAGAALAGTGSDKIPEAAAAPLTGAGVTLRETVEQPARDGSLLCTKVAPSIPAAEASTSSKQVKQRCAGGPLDNTSTGAPEELSSATAGVAVAATDASSAARTRTAALVVALSALCARGAANEACTVKSAASAFDAPKGTLVDDSELVTANLAHATCPEDRGILAAACTSVGYEALPANKGSEFSRQCSKSKAAEDVGTDIFLSADSAVAGQKSITSASDVSAVTALQNAQLPQTEAGVVDEQVPLTTGQVSAVAAPLGRKSNRATSARWVSVVTYQGSLVSTGKTAPGVGSKGDEAQVTHEPSVVSTQIGNSPVRRGTNAAAAARQCPERNPENASAVSTGSGRMAERIVTHTKGFNVPAQRSIVSWNKKSERFQEVEAAHPTKTPIASTDEGMKGNSLKGTGRENWKRNCAEERAPVRRERTSHVDAAMTRSRTVKEKGVAANSSDRDHSGVSHCSMRRCSHTSSNNFRSRRNSSNSLSGSVSDSSKIAYCWSVKQVKNTESRSSELCRTEGKNRAGEETRGKQQSGEEKESLLQQQHQSKPKDAGHSGASPDLQPGKGKKNIPQGIDEEGTFTRAPEKETHRQDQQHKENLEHQLKGSPGLLTCCNGYKQCPQEHEREEKDDEREPCDRKDQSRQEQGEETKVAKHAEIKCQAKHVAQDNDECSEKPKQRVQLSVDVEITTHAQGEDASSTNPAASGITAVAPTVPAGEAGPLHTGMEAVSPTEGRATCGTSAAQGNSGSADSTTSGDIEKVTAAAAAKDSGRNSTNGKSTAATAASEAPVAQAAAQDRVEARNDATPDDEAASDSPRKVSLTTKVELDAQEARSGEVRRDTDVETENEKDESSSDHLRESATKLEQDQADERATLGLTHESLSTMRKACASSVSVVGEAAARAEWEPGVKSHVVSGDSLTPNAPVATQIGESAHTNIHREKGWATTKTTVVPICGEQHQEENDGGVCQQQQQQKNGFVQQHREMHQGGENDRMLNEDQQGEDGEHSRERPQGEGIRPYSEARAASQQESETAAHGLQEQKGIYGLMEGQQRAECPIIGEEPNTEKHVGPRYDAHEQEKQSPKKELEQLDHGQQQGENHDCIHESEVSRQICEKRFTDVINVLPHLLRLLQQQVQQLTVGDPHGHHDKENQRPSAQHPLGDHCARQSSSQAEDRSFDCTREHHQCEQQRCTNVVHAGSEQALWFSSGLAERHQSGTPQETKLLGKYPLGGKNIEDAKDQQPGVLLKCCAGADEKANDLKGTESWKRGEGLSIDYLRAAVEAKLCELRRQQQESRINLQPFVEDAAALLGYLEHIKTQQAVMQRQISLLQKQLLHMDQQQATLEQQRYQLKCVQEHIRWCQAQLLKARGLSVYHQHPLLHSLYVTDTESQQQQRQERQGDSLPQRGPQEAVIQASLPQQQKTLLRGELMEHAKCDDEVLQAQRQGEGVRLHHERATAPSRQQPQSLECEQGKTQLLEGRQRQLAFQLMQELSCRLTPPVQQYQQLIEDPSPSIQLPQHGKQQVELKRLSPLYGQQQSDAEFRKTLQEHRHRQQQKGFAHLLEQQEDEDLAQAGILPQHQRPQTQGDYTGSVSESLERRLIKLTSSDSCLNPELAADSSLLPVTPSQEARSSPGCSIPQALAADAARAAPLADANEAAAASLPAASSAATSALIPPPGARGATILPQEPHNTCLYSDDASKEQQRQTQADEPTQTERETEGSEEDLLGGMQVKYTKQPKRKHSGDCTGHRAASMSRAADPGPSTAPERDVATLGCSQHQEQLADTHILEAAPIVASRPGACPLVAATSGETTTPVSRADIEKAASCCVTMAGNPGSAAIARTCTLKEVHENAPAAGTLKSRHLFPAAHEASQGIPISGPATAASTVAVVARTVSSPVATRTSENIPQVEARTETKQEQPKCTYGDNHDTAMVDRDALYFLLEDLVGAGNTVKEEGTAGAARKAATPKATEITKETAAVLLEAWEWLGCHAVVPEEYGRPREAPAELGAPDARDDAEKGRCQQGAWKHERRRQSLLNMQRQRRDPRQQQMAQLYEEELAGSVHKAAPKPVEMADRDVLAARLMALAARAVKLIAEGHQTSGREHNHTERARHEETLEWMTGLYKNPAAEVFLAAKQAEGERTAPNGRKEQLPSSDALIAPSEKQKESEKTAATARTPSTADARSAAQRCCCHFGATEEQLHPSTWQQRKQQAEKVKQPEQQNKTKDHRRQNGERYHTELQKARTASSVADFEQVDVAQTERQPPKLAVDQRTAAASLSFPAAASSLSIATFTSHSAACSVHTSMGSDIAGGSSAAAAACDSLRPSPAADEGGDMTLATAARQQVPSSVAAPAATHEADGPEASDTIPVRTAALAERHAEKAGTQTAEEKQVRRTEATTAKLECVSNRCEGPPPETTPALEKGGQKREGSDPERSCTWSNSGAEQRGLPLWERTLKPPLYVADRQSYDKNCFHGASLKVPETAPSPSGEPAATARPSPTVPVTAAAARAPASTTTLLRPPSPAGASEERATTGVTIPELYPLEEEIPTASTASLAPFPMRAAALAPEAPPREIQLQAVTAIQTEEPALKPATITKPEERSHSRAACRPSARGAGNYLGSPYYTGEAIFAWNAAQTQLGPGQELRVVPHQRERQQWQSEEATAQWKKVAERTAPWQQATPEGREREVLQYSQKLQIAVKRPLSSATLQYSSVTDALVPSEWRASSSSRFFGGQSEKEGLSLEQRKNRLLLEQLALQLCLPPTQANANVFDDTGGRLSLEEVCFSPGAHIRRSELVPVATARSRSAASCFVPLAPATDSGTPCSIAYSSATGSSATVRGSLADHANEYEAKRPAIPSIHVHDVSRCCLAGSSSAATSHHEVEQRHIPDGDRTAGSASSVQELLIRVQQQSASSVPQLSQLPAGPADAWISPRPLVSNEECKRVLIHLTAGDVGTHTSVSAPAAADVRSRNLSSFVTARGEMEKDSAASLQDHLAVQQAHMTTQHQCLSTHQQPVELREQQQNVNQQQKTELTQSRQTGSLAEGEDSFELRPCLSAEGLHEGFTTFPDARSQMPQQQDWWTPKPLLLFEGEPEQQHLRTLSGQKERADFLTRQGHQRQHLKMEKPEQLHELHQIFQEESEHRQQQMQRRSSSVSTQRQKRCQDCSPMTSHPIMFTSNSRESAAQALHPLEAFPKELVLQPQQRANTISDLCSRDIREPIPARAVHLSDTDAGASSTLRTHSETAETLARRTRLAVPVAGERPSRRSPQATPYAFDTWESSPQQRAKHWDSRSSRKRTSSSNAIAVCVGRVEEGARTRSPIASTQALQAERRGGTAGEKRRKGSVVAIGIATPADGIIQPGDGYCTRAYADDNISADISCSPAATSKCVSPITLESATAVLGRSSWRRRDKRRSDEKNCFYNAQEYSCTTKGRDASCGRHSVKGCTAGLEAFTAAIAAGDNHRRAPYPQHHRPPRTRGQRFLGGTSICSRYAASQQRHLITGWREDSAAATPPPPPRVQEQHDVTVASEEVRGITGGAERGVDPEDTERGAPDKAGACLTGFAELTDITERAEGLVEPPRGTLIHAEVGWTGRSTSSPRKSGVKGRTVQLVEEVPPEERHPPSNAASVPGCQGGRPFPSQHQHHRQYWSVSTGEAPEHWNHQEKGHSSSHVVPDSATFEYSGSIGAKGACLPHNADGVVASGISSSSVATAAAAGEQRQTPGASRAVEPASSASALALPPFSETTLAKAQENKTSGGYTTLDSAHTFPAAFWNEKEAAKAGGGFIAAAVEPGPTGRRNGYFDAASTERGEAAAHTAATTESADLQAGFMEEAGGMNIKTRSPDTTQVEPSVSEDIGQGKAVEETGDEDAPAAPRSGGFPGAARTTAEPGSRRARRRGRAAVAEAGAPAAAGGQDGAAKTTTFDAACAGTVGMETKEECTTGEAEKDNEKKGFTTVMLRNIPNKYSRQQVMEEIDVHFKGTYNFFYLPIDFVHGCNVGYCFINFLDVATAEAFRQEFEGKRLSLFKSRKICSVTYGRVQGLKAILEHYFHSAVVQAQYASWRPVVLKDCVELPWSELHNVFPELFKGKYPASPSSSSAFSAARHRATSCATAASDKGHSYSSLSASASCVSCAGATAAKSKPASNSSLHEDRGSHATTAVERKKGAAGLGTRGTSPEGPLALGQENVQQRDESARGSSGASGTAAAKRKPKTEGGLRGGANTDSLRVTEGTAGAELREQSTNGSGADCKATSHKWEETEAGACSDEAADVVAAPGEPGALQAGASETWSRGAGGLGTTSSSVGGDEVSHGVAVVTGVDEETRTAEGHDRPEGAAGTAGARADLTPPVCGSLLLPRCLSIGQRRGRKLGVTIEARRREMRNLASKHGFGTYRCPLYRDSLAAAGAISAAARHRGPHAWSPGPRLRFHSKSNSGATGPAATTAGRYKKYLAGPPGHEAPSFAPSTYINYDRCAAVRGPNVARCRGYIHPGRDVNLADAVAAVGTAPLSEAALVSGVGAGGAGTAGGLVHRFSGAEAHQQGQQQQCRPR